MTFTANVCQTVLNPFVLCVDLITSHAIVPNAACAQATKICGCAHNVDTQAAAEPRAVTLNGTISRTQIIISLVKSEHREFGTTKLITGFLIPSASL